MHIGVTFLFYSVFKPTVLWLAKILFADVVTMQDNIMRYGHADFPAGAKTQLSAVLEPLSIMVQSILFCALPSMHSISHFLAVPVGFSGTRVVAMGKLYWKMLYRDDALGLKCQKSHAQAKLNTTHTLMSVYEQTGKDYSSEINVKTIPYSRCELADECQIFICLLFTFWEEP